MSDTTTTLTSYIKERMLLVCHHNADPDAAFSAYAFKELVNQIQPGTHIDILLPGGSSTLTKKLVEKYEVSIMEDVSLDDYEIIYLLDTASFNQLDEWEDRIKETDKPVIVIDHHAVHPALQEKASMYIHDEDASSACEIVAELYHSHGKTPGKKVAEVLILGIAYDSKHLRLSKPRTLRIVAELLEHTEKLSTLLNLLHSEPSKSEKTARLKAAQRLQITEIDGWTITSAEIGAFQSSVARSFIGLGADVAILAGSEKKHLKVSMRSTDRFYKETGIHLGRDVSLALSYEFDGAGSGHPTAAGFNGTGSIENVLTKSVELLKEQIENHTTQD